jgi:hypothetical protein
VTFREVMTDSGLRVRFAVTVIRIASAYTSGLRTNDNQFQEAQHTQGIRSQQPNLCYTVMNMSPRVGSSGAMNHTV